MQEIHSTASILKSHLAGGRGDPYELESVVEFEERREIKKTSHTRVFALGSPPAAHG